jgi:hypothetical protein
MPSAFHLRDLPPHERRSFDSKKWVRPFTAVRIPSAERDDVDALLAAAALILPAGSALSGWAAARLHGDRWSSGRDRVGRHSPIPVTVPPPLQLAKRRSLDIIRSKLAPADVITRRGLPVTTPARTALDLARLLPRDQAVAAVDALLATRTVSIRDLEGAIRDHPRIKGRPAAASVMQLASPFAESPPESVMRLVWHDLGLRSLMVNATILDNTGLFMGRVDLLDPKAGLVGEYQGDQHRSPDTYRADLRRKRGLESLGLIVVEAAGGDLGSTSYRVEVMQQRHRGLARDRSLDRWRIGPRRSFS